VDHLPLARPSRPRPHRNTLTLLVGRVTTIKLAYWSAVTAVELALPVVLAGPLTSRLDGGDATDEQGERVAVRPWPRGPR